MSSLSHDVDEALTEEVLTTMLLSPYGTRGTVTASKINWKKFFEMPTKEARNASLRFLLEREYLVNPQAVEEAGRYDHGYFVPVDVTVWQNGKHPDVCPRIESDDKSEPVRLCFVGARCVEEYLRAMPNFQTGRYAVKIVVFSLPIV